MRTNYRNSVRLSIRLSVRPSVRPSVVCHDPVPIQAQVTLRLRFLPHDSTLVCCDQILCNCVRRFSSKEGAKEGYPLRNRYLTAINSSIVRTVADRNILAAYHNRHCWRAFRGYQHRWPWTTLNFKIKGFCTFITISGCDTHFKSEVCRNYWRLTKTTCI